MFHSGDVPIAVISVIMATITWFFVRRWFENFMSRNSVPVMSWSTSAAKALKTEALVFPSRRGDVYVGGRRCRTCRPVGLKYGKPLLEIDGRRGRIAVKRSRRNLLAVPANALHSL